MGSLPNRPTTKPKPTKLSIKRLISRITLYSAWLDLFEHRYVRVYLLPDQRDGRQTPVQRKTQNPVFNQGFTYELAHREVLKRTLMLKVQDLNRSNHRHHVIGQVLLPLSDLNLIKGVHIWKRIRPTDQVSLYKQYTLYSSTILCTEGIADA